MLRVILADVVPPHIPRPRAERHFAELARLIETLGGMTIVKIIQKRGRPSGSTYIGTGKADEIGILAKELAVDAVVINGILKGNQIHELKQRISVRVWDRVDVILRIFEQHATTAEAKLQVKRARLAYDIPKLYRRDATTLFERERGGGTIQRGAGESGIEAEKRHIREHIRRIDRELDIVRRQRDNQRRQRARAGLPVVAIVGYTNAGKSSLLRAMTGKKVYVADKLFATLDTRLSGLWLPRAQKKILLADTIGFIENLPPELIAAFRATLEEAAYADILLHVYDAADSAVDIRRKQQTVATVLADIGAADRPTIFVANKVDLLTLAKRTALTKKKNVIAISAVANNGFDALIERVENVLTTLPPRW